MCFLLLKLLIKKGKFSVKILNDCKVFHSYFFGYDLYSFMASFCSLSSGDRNTCTIADGIFRFSFKNI
jgi:hypothetical protein